MHILLTGEVQVGKSTAINRFIKEFRLSADGFRTYWVSAEDGGSDLFIGPYGNQLSVGDSFKCAHRGYHERQVFPEAFDNAAETFLKECGNKDIIVLDELGFMEKDALLFQNTVIDILDGIKPVMGVIKPKHTPFLDKIRSLSNVETVWITPESRSQVFDELCSRYNSGTLF